MNQFLTRSARLSCFFLRISLLCTAGVLAIGLSSFAASHANHPKGIKVSSVSCIGPQNATHFMIYLHGADLPKTNAYEREARRILAEVADTLKIRIAVPRSPLICPNSILGERCWWIFDRPELVEETMASAIDSRTHCFSGDETFGILGFSNGGYLLNHWMVQAQCHLPTATTAPYWMSSFAAIGAHIPESRYDLAFTACPWIQYVIGRTDQSNYDQTFYLKFSSMGAPLLQPMIVFDGGHRMDRDALQRALNEIFSRVRSPH